MRQVTCRPLPLPAAPGPAPGNTGGFRPLLLVVAPVSPSRPSRCRKPSARSPKPRSPCLPAPPCNRGLMRLDMLPAECCPSMWQRCHVPRKCCRSRCCPSMSQRSHAPGGAADRGAAPAAPAAPRAPLASAAPQNRWSGRWRGIPRVPGKGPTSALSLGPRPCAVAMRLRAASACANKGCCWQGAASPGRCRQAVSPVYHWQQAPDARHVCWPMRWCQRICT